MSTADERYLDSRFCGRCHQGTYAEWKEATVQEKKTCQQCHMPSVRRKLTQPTDIVSSLIVAFEEEIPQRRHLFAVAVSELEAAPFTLERFSKVSSAGRDCSAHEVPAEIGRSASSNRKELLGDTIDVSRPEETVVSITLRNNLPHAVPTGDFGVRTITIRASTGTEPKHIERQSEWELASKLGNALPPGSSRTWRFTIPAEHTQLRVQVFRHAPGTEEDNLVFDSAQSL